MPPYLQLAALSFCLLTGGCGFLKDQELRQPMMQYSATVKQHNLAAMRDFSESEEAVYNSIVIEIVSPEVNHGRQITVYYNMEEEGTHAICKAGTYFRFKTSIDIFIDSQYVFLDALEDIEVMGVKYNAPP